MRKINTADLFAAARIIRASGMRDQLLPVIRQAATEIDAAETPETKSDILTKIGINSFLTVFEAMAERKTESAIYEALAGPLECKPEDVQNMPVVDLVPALEQLVEENNLKIFFKSLSGILGKT